MRARVLKVSSESCLADFEFYFSRVFSCDCVFFVFFWILAHVSLSVTVLLKISLRSVVLSGSVQK